MGKLTAIHMDREARRSYSRPPPPPLARDKGEWVDNNISFKCLRAGSEVSAFTLCMILHTMWSVKSLQLLCILPFLNCFVLCGCVLRRYINVCNGDLFSVVNMYLYDLKFCVVCINGRCYVCCGDCCVVSNECAEPTPDLCDLLVLMVLGFALRVSLASWIVMIYVCVLWISIFSSSSLFLISFMLTWSIMRILSLCVVCVVTWLSLVCLLGCLGTLCGECNGSSDCDT